jgi:hypothetical protein
MIRNIDSMRADQAAISIVFSLWMHITHGVQ